MGCAITTAGDIRNVDPSDQPKIPINKTLPLDPCKNPSMLSPGPQTVQALIESSFSNLPNSESTPINQTTQTKHIQNDSLFCSPVDTPHFLSSPHRLLNSRNESGRSSLKPIEFDNLISPHVNSQMPSENPFQPQRLQKSLISLQQNALDNNANIFRRGQNRIDTLNSGARSMGTVNSELEYSSSHLTSKIPLRVLSRPSDSNGTPEDCKNFLEKAFGDIFNSPCLGNFEPNFNLEQFLRWHS